MKKLITILILISASARAQAVQELGKYSYFCFAVDGTKATDGTCFFYKFNNDIYVVTNYHIFYGTDILAGRQVLHVDTLRISYISAKTNKQAFYKVINDKDDVRFFKHYDQPDLMAKKLDDIPADFKVNLINDVFEPAYLDCKPQGMALFGYPAMLAKIAGPEQAESQRCFLTTGNNAAGGLQLTDLNFEQEANNTGRKIGRKINKTEFKVGVGALPGFSGSPVYGRFIKNNQAHYKFIGVVFASDIANNFSVAIKAKVFYNYIKNLAAANEGAAPVLAKVEPVTDQQQYSGTQVVSAPAEKINRGL